MMIERAVLTAFVAGALLGCSGDASLPLSAEPRFAKGGGSGGSPTLSVLTMAGDLGPLRSATGGDVTAALGRSPFKNLTLSNVVITIGDAALSGDGARCRVLMPTRTVVPTGEANEWDSRVQGEWRGELAIWQGRNTSESNMKFAGTRPDDSSVAIQFTSNSTNAQQVTDGTTTMLQFIDAPLGFGAGPGRIVPRDEAGMPIIYCVNVTVTATAPS